MKALVLPQLSRDKGCFGHAKVIEDFGTPFALKFLAFGWRKRFGGHNDLFDRARFQIKPVKLGEVCKMQAITRHPCQIVGLSSRIVRVDPFSDGVFAPDPAQGTVPMPRDFRGAREQMANRMNA